MSLVVFDVAVTQKIRTTPVIVELKIERRVLSDALHLFADLLPRLFADHPVEGVDDLPAAFGEPTLLKLREGRMTVRVPILDEALAAAVKKGQTWESRAHPVSWPSVLSIRWAPDGKTILTALDNGVAELVRITKKGIGAVGAYLNHPGLVAADHGGTQLMTAGRDRVRLWDAKGKAIQEILTTPAPITAARLFEGGVVVGLQSGAVMRWTSGQWSALTAAGGDPVVALDVRGDAIAAATADRIQVWATAGAAPTTHTADAALTAVALFPDGRVAAGDAVGDAWIWSGAGSPTHHPAPDRGALNAYQSALTADARAWYTWDEDGVWLVSLNGETTRLCEAGNVRLAQDSPSGRYRLVSGRMPDRLYLYRADGTLIRTLHTVPMGQRYNRYIGRFSPSEKWFAVHRSTHDNKNGAIIVLEVEGGGAIALPNQRGQNGSWINGFEWLDDDTLMADYSNEPNKRWAVSTGTPSPYLSDTSGGVIVSFKGGVITAVNQVLSVYDSDGALVRSQSIASLFESCYQTTLIASEDGRRVVLMNHQVGAVLIEDDAAPWWIEAADPKHRRYAIGTRDVKMSPSGRWLVVRQSIHHTAIIDLDQRTVRSVQDDMGYGPFDFDAAQEHLISIRLGGVYRVPLDGGADEKIQDLPTQPRRYPVKALQSLEDGGLAVSDRYRSRIVSDAHTKDARCSGWIAVSPNGKRCVMVVDRGLSVHEMERLHI
ncbi:MAG: hypothetical protein AAFV53_04910 [Myxococcota bacterium]